MKKRKSIKQIIGNKEFLLGLILGAGVGYIGEILAFFVDYLFYGKIQTTPFFLNLSWGIFLIVLWFWFIKKIQRGGSNV